MSTRMNNPAVWLVIAAGLVAPATVLADEPKATPAPAAKPVAPAAEPTLDELLGLTKPGAAKPADAPTREDLDRRLREPESGDILKEATALMEQAAKRLSGDAADTSLDTQRVQEDVLLKLDQAIAQARKQRQQQQQQQQKQQQKQQQQQQSQQDQQQQQDQQDQQAQAQQQQGQQQSREQKSQDANQAGERNGRREGMGPELEAARAAWGALPQRVREMLLQGSGEKYSSTYQQQTADYYKRLAEQKKQR